MNIVSLIIQLVSGAAGGNIAGSLLKKLDLGPVGNSIAGSSPTTRPSGGARPN